MLDIKTLPSLEDYAKAGIKLKPEVYGDLKLSSWEDNVHLFVRVCNFSSLEIDRRPHFYNWARGLSFSSKAEFEAFFPGEDYWEEYQEKGVIPIYLYIKAREIWAKNYPKETFVETTKVGDFLLPYLKELQEKDIFEDFIHNEISAFLREIEFMYRTCAKSPMYLDIPFDWQALLQKRFNVGQLEDFHRKYYGSLSVGELIGIYKNWMFIGLLKNDVIKRLALDFKVDLGTTMPVSKLLCKDLIDNLNRFQVDKDLDEGLIQEKKDAWKELEEDFGILWNKDVIEELILDSCVF